MVRKVLKTMFPKYYFYDNNNHVVGLTEKELLSKVKQQMKQETTICEMTLAQELNDDLDFLNDPQNKMSDKIEIALAYLANNGRHEQLI